MDWGYDEWQKKQNEFNKLTVPIVPYPLPIVPPPIPQLTQEEIESFRRLLEKAKQYDIDHNEPDCELASKKQRLIDLAQELGVNIKFDD